MNKPTQKQMDNLSRSIEHLSFLMDKMRKKNERGCTAEEIGIYVQLHKEYRISVAEINRMDKREDEKKVEVKQVEEQLSGLVCRNVECGRYGKDLECIRNIYRQRDEWCCSECKSWGLSTVIINRP